ncbi:MAG TPA: hypothetical protein VGK99_17545 [Acidobacteriota bacterium]
MAHTEKSKQRKSADDSYSERLKTTAESAPKQKAQGWKNTAWGNIETPLILYPLQYGKLSDLSFALAAGLSEILANILSRRPSCTRRLSL